MNSLTSKLFFGFMFLVNLISVNAFGGPIDDLQPGQWYEVPNSKIRDVVPNPVPPGMTGPPAIVGAWSGGAVDSVRDRYIVTGGGHGDYAGNELYSFDLSTLHWSRIWDPTPNSQIPPINLDVRASPSMSATVLGNQSNGTQGTVIAGSVSADGWTWWQINYDTGADGWSREDFLIRLTTSPTPPLSTKFLVSDRVQVFAAGREAYLDGNPASRHTYGGIQYLPNVDRLFINGGSLWGGSGGFGKSTWFFDFGSLTWQQKASIDAVYQYGTIPYSAYDPVTGHVFEHRYIRFGEYDPVADTWTTRGGYGAGTTPAGTAVIDPKRRKFLIIGGNAVAMYDLNQANSTLTFLTTTGDTAPVAAAYPGVDYDPVSDRIVAWIGGADVYSLNLDTLVWTKLPPASTNTVIPTNPTSTGTHGRWRYIPSKNAFIVVNSIDQDVYAYKLSSGGGTVSAPPPSGLPAGQWIAIPLPRLNDGTFGADLNSGGKHSMIAFNPLNGRMYMNGGDFNGAGSFSSYRQMTFSFSLPQLLADPSNPNAAWTIEYPECGPGPVQPKHPDFTGWFWDSNRGVFWMVPGVMEATSSGNCAGESSNNTSDPGFDHDHLMTFNPATKTWTSSWYKWNPDHTQPGSTWDSVYDPVKDVMIRPFNWNNTALDILNLATGTWSYVRYGVNAVGQAWDLSHNYLSVDYVGRQIYAVTGGRLYSISLDSYTFTDLGAVPQSATDGENKTVWDSNNNVLIYNAYPYNWWAYHPATKQWEQLPNLTATGLTASGRIMGYEPNLGAVIVWAQNLNQPDPTIQPSTPYMFVYRYGSGSGTPAPTASLPPAPTNLTVQ